MEMENISIGKKITFCGINNKYQMKKMTNKKCEPKKRVVTNKWDFSPECFLIEKQLQLLTTIHSIKNSEIEKGTHETECILKELERKMYGYKQQDTDKKVFEIDKFITVMEVIKKMIETQLDCYYCHEKMLVLYENVREGRQWSIDRDDNDKGHNKDNYVLACLECNLKRKRRRKGDFLFTKQLQIVRENF